MCFLLCWKFKSSDSISEDWRHWIFWMCSNFWRINSRMKWYKWNLNKASRRWRWWERGENSKSWNREGWKIRVRERGWNEKVEQSVIFFSSARSSMSAEKIGFFFFEFEGRRNFLRKQSPNSLDWIVEEPSRVPPTFSNVSHFLTFYY